MAGPNPLFIFLLYRNYRKKFLNDPNNLGKQPNGCFVWYFGFVFKLFGIVLIIAVVLYLILGLIELF